MRGWRLTFRRTMMFLCLFLKPSRSMFDTRESRLKFLSCSHKFRAARFLMRENLFSKCRPQVVRLENRSKCPELVASSTSTAKLMTSPLSRISTQWEFLQPHFELTLRERKRVASQSRRRDELAHMGSQSIRHCSSTTALERTLFHFRCRKPGSGLTTRERRKQGLGLGR